MGETSGDSEEGEGQSRSHGLFSLSQGPLATCLLSSLFN